MMLKAQRRGTSVISPAQNDSRLLARKIAIQVAGITQCAGTDTKAQELIGLDARNGIRHDAELNRIEFGVFIDESAAPAVEPIDFSGVGIEKRLRPAALGHLRDRIDALLDVVPIGRE